MNQAKIAEHKSAVEQLFAQPFERTNYICHWSKKNKLVYVETPKVACTTIKRTLHKAEVGDASGSSIPRNVHDRKRSPLLAPIDDAHSFVAAMSAPDTHKFSFVRNPFTRVLSCYLEKMVQNPIERKRLAPQLDLGTEEAPSFLHFLSAIAEQGDNERDIHWAPQTYLIRPNRIRYSFIGRFEFFSSQFRLFCNRINLGDYAIDLPPTDHATNATDQTQQYYGKQEEELVQTIYERDFINFGYGWSSSFA